MPDRGPNHVGEAWGSEHAGDVPEVYGVVGVWVDFGDTGDKQAPGVTTEVCVKAHAPSETDVLRTLNQHDVPRFNLTH